MTLTARKTLSISIITPVLNEEQQIVPLLDSLAGSEGDFEHIFVDGGSTDRTCALLQQYPVRLLCSPPGRGLQQNIGAEAASGDILLFLHCDTRLPDNFPALIQGALNTPGKIAGAFSLAIDHPGWPYRLVEKGANLRSRLLNLPYGDQALFMKKSAFERSSGFPDHPILEEITLLRRLRRLGSIGIIAAPATTSHRRWQRLGIIQTTLINQILLAGFFMGFSPQRLARLYFRDSSGSGGVS